MLTNRRALKNPHLLEKPEIAFHYINTNKCLKKISIKLECNSKEGKILNFQWRSNAKGKTPKTSCNKRAQLKAASGAATPPKMHYKSSDN